MKIEPNFWEKENFWEKSLKGSRNCLIPVSQRVDFPGFVARTCPSPRKPSTLSPQGSLFSPSCLEAPYFHPRAWRLLIFTLGLEGSLFSPLGLEAPYFHPSAWRLPIFTLGLEGSLFSPLGLKAHYFDPSAWRLLIFTLGLEGYLFPPLGLKAPYFHPLPWRLPIFTLRLEGNPGFFYFLTLSIFQRLPILILQFESAAPPFIHR